MGQDDVFSVHITDLNHSGEGVGRKDGRVVFVPYATPGDIAVVRIVEERRVFARAELLSLERESPDRVLPPCPVYLQCGGCQLQHIAYDAQLAYKKRRVEQALRRIGKFDDIPVRDCLPAPLVFHYRNKARFSYSARRADSSPDRGAAQDGGAGAARRVGDRSGFVSGFYGRSTHDVVDFNECLIQNRTNNEVFQALNALLARRGIPVWNSAVGEPGEAGAGRMCAAAGPQVEAGRPQARPPRRGAPRTGGLRTVSRCAGGYAAACGGALKHLVVRCNRDGGQALAVLVPCGGPLYEVEQVAYELMLAVPKLVGVVEEVEPASGGGEEDAGGGRGGRTSDGGLSQGSGRRQSRRAVPRLVRGVGFLRERILGLEFTVSADSFLQVNAEGMEVLYHEVLRAADLSGGEVALDAYCGVGSISLALARECRKVFGIEEVRSAVADARRNAALNSLTDCVFIAGRVEDVLATEFAGAAGSPGRVASLLPRHVDVVVLDPPRAGCDVRALRALALLEPSRIVYVSCDPETLARDLRILAGVGYKLANVQPVDMFPQTSHVETVVLMSSARKE
ncbi:MAG: 23S rRNA (uracil(1939)-C(5))-methyltransferase RlmD [Betaproteobacteria bacterium]